MKRLVVLFALLLFGLGVSAIEDVPMPQSASDKSAPGAAPKGYPREYTAVKMAELEKLYKHVSKEPVIHVALDMLRQTSGEFSRQALLGNNLSQRNFIIEFKQLGDIDKSYESFDALGWKKQVGVLGKKDQLYVFINPRHKDATPGALAALLAHEALHQDEFNSLAEETYAWTMEAAVWCEIAKIHPVSNDTLHPLIKRENTLKRLYERGNYTDAYIKKTVHSNDGYRALPSTSPGFETL